jgi:hypothetical protein
VLHFALQVSPKSRFIAKEGILRRGTLVGAILTALYVALSHGEQTTASGSSHFLAVVVLCFLESAIGAGWIIGAIMWSLREQATRRNRRTHL